MNNINLFLIVLTYCYTHEKWLQNLKFWYLLTKLAIFKYIKKIFRLITNSREVYLR